MLEALKNSYFKIVGTIFLQIQIALLQCSKMVQSLVLGLGNKFQGALYPFLAALIFSKLIWAKLLGDFFPPESKQRGRTSFFLSPSFSHSLLLCFSLFFFSPFFNWAYIGFTNTHQFFSVITVSRHSCSVWLYSPVLWISWVFFTLEKKKSISWLVEEPM